MTFYNKCLRELNKALYAREDLTERVIKAKQFMDLHYDERLDLDAICEEACVSKYYFIRLFKKFYGVTPYRYLTEVRVARAKELIRDGMSVQRACFAVGYDSATSFSALFKRVTGSAPSRVCQNSNFE